MTQLEGPTTSTTTPIEIIHPGESWENPGQASGPGQFESDDENEEFFDNVQRPTHVNNGSRIRASLSPPSPQRPARVQEDRDPQPPLITTEAVIKGAVKGTVFIARYSLDVFSNALHWLTWPLAVLVGLWLLVTIFSYISLQLSSAFPLCIISWSGMCQPLDTPPTSGQRVMWADYPALIDAQNKIFEQLLECSVGGSALSLEIKNAEMATKDMVALVRISGLIHW
jgi:hypothetical protein